MRRFATVALILPFVLAACSKPVQRVDDAWVRLGASPSAPAAAYFTVHGGATDDQLVDVSSPVVIRTELHEATMTGTMASMTPINHPIPVPAKGKVEFKPGGRHAMLFDVNPGITPGKTLPLIFTFASGEEIHVDAGTEVAGAPTK